MDHTDLRRPTRGQATPDKGRLNILPTLVPRLLDFPFPCVVLFRHVYLLVSRLTLVWMCRVEAESEAVWQAPETVQRTSLMGVLKKCLSFIFSSGI
jgi:hypothetical protein